MKEEKNRNEKKVWVVFAIIGFVLAMISFGLFYTSGFAMSELAICGIVFSSLGLTTSNRSKHKMAIVGLIFSILALILNVICSILWFRYSYNLIYKIIKSFINEGMLL